jgi:hypothetical protein
MEVSMPAPRTPPGKALLTRRQALAAGALVTAPAAARGQIRQSRLLTARFYYDVAADLPANITWGTLWALEARFTRVRLFYQLDVSTLGSIQGAQIGLPGSATDAFGLGAGASKPAWTPVTFADQGLAHGLARAPIPGFLFSDWIAVPAPAEAGGLALLMTRTFIGPGGRGTPAPVGAERAWAGVSQGRLQQSYRWNGAQLGAAATPVVGAGFMVPACLQYDTAAPGVTVMGVGDSLMQGFHTISGLDGLGFQACAMVSTPQHPVQWCLQGRAGETAADYFHGFDAAMEWAQPGIVILQTWSRNSPPTTAAADDEWAATLAAIARVKAAGAMPILMPPWPNASMTAGIEPLRLEALRRARGMARTVAVLDVEGLLGTGAFPNRLRPEFDSGDGVHPNDAAHAAVAKLLARVIKLPLK